MASGYYIADKTMFSAVMFVKKLVETKELNDSVSLSARHYSVDKELLLSEYKKYKEGNPSLSSRTLACGTCKRPYDKKPIQDTKKQDIDRPLYTDMFEETNEDV